jgi:Coenzyme PQQ synthesis protein D (PqqD)
MDWSAHVDEELANEVAPDETEHEVTLTVPLSYKPLKSADVLELDMGDGLILYNHDGDLVHHLNPSAGLIWQLCDGAVTVGQLGAEIAEQYGLDVETAQGEVAAVVAEFDTLGLVQDPRRIELREGKPNG